MARLEFQLAEVVAGLRKRGVLGERGVERLTGRVGQLQRLQRQAQIVVGLGEPGLERNRPLQRLPRLRPTLPAPQRVRLVKPPAGRVRIQRQHARNGRQRLLNLVQLQTGGGEAVPRFGKRRPERGRPAERIARRRPLTQHPIQVPQIVRGHGIVGVELDGRLVGRLRFLRLAQVFERVAQIDVEKGLARIQGNRRLHALQRQVQIPRLLLEHAQVVQGRGMLGLCGQDRFVAAPRLRQAPLLVQAHAGGEVHGSSHR